MQVRMMRVRPLRHDTLVAHDRGGESTENRFEVSIAGTLVAIGQMTGDGVSAVEWMGKRTPKQKHAISTLMAAYHLTIEAFNGGNV